MKSDFAQNLALLCAERGSIAKTCQEIGIIPQQFNKYLNGSTLPSAFTMHKISSFFGISKTLLFAPHETFGQSRRNRGSGRSGRSGRSRNPLLDAFPGDISRLRPLLGAYHSFFKTPAWPGCYMTSAIFLYEQDGLIYSRTIERGLAPSMGRMQRSRYDGLVSYHGERIFNIEYEVEHDGSIVETILSPPHRQNKRYLEGLGIGLAWRPRRTPYVQKTIWRRAHTSLSVRQILEQCGVYPGNSVKIDPIVRAYLNSETV